MVFLGGEAHAPVLEPRESVALGEALQQSPHQPVATGIDGREVAHVLKGIGAVAASASGDLDFLEDVLAALEDGDLHPGAQLPEVDGEEEACSSSADDGCMQG